MYGPWSVLTVLSEETKASYAVSEMGDVYYIYYHPKGGEHGLEKSYWTVISERWGDGNALNRDVVYRG